MGDIKRFKSQFGTLQITRHDNPQGLETKVTLDKPKQEEEIYYKGGSSVASQYRVPF
jgi:hypothetical protein